ncbi:hypothetical protein RFI_37250, partial [Reticulomyxa filosa]
FLHIPVSIVGFIASLYQILLKEKNTLTHSSFDTTPLLQSIYLQICFNTSIFEHIKILIDKKVSMVRLFPKLSPTSNNQNVHTTTIKKSAFCFSVLLFAKGKFCDHVIPIQYSCVFEKEHCKKMN